MTDIINGKTILSTPFTEEDIQVPEKEATNKTDYEFARQVKGELLAKAADNFFTNGAISSCIVVGSIFFTRNKLFWME